MRAELYATTLQGIVSPDVLLIVITGNCLAGGGMRSTECLSSYKLFSCVVSAFKPFCPAHIVLRDIYICSLYCEQ